ncbi:MAG: hypothetical protein FWD18_01390 [Micrococcales bacterium]|nr:hypothetical protein [Micrococcales bacterium]
MTMLETLFGLVPAGSTGQQWLARDLQLVNWGGYDGHHQVRLAPTATLLSGGSGSGKSTLMDAYIALLMPHTTPFNGASNGGVVGRPRGKDQRNVISYARGKVDEARTDDGTRQRVLRGDGQDTWSAIAMTWADQTGAVFTALRAWYVPATARTMDDLVKVRATFDGPFDLRDLQDAATHRLGLAALKATGLVCSDSDRDFTARLHSTLGIGAAGGGSKAVALLGRIQAGQQITTVDALYKAMVLEEPETLAKAEEVVEHFDQLSDTRTRMLTAQQQVRALQPIRQHRAEVDAARERAAVIDTVGSCGTGPSSAATPAALWRHGRRLDLLRAAERDVQERLDRARRLATELGARVDATKAQLAGVRQTLWASGGDRLDQARRELDRARARQAQVAQARAALDAAAATLGATVTCEEDFDALTATVRAQLADTGSRSSVLDGLLAARTLAEKAEGELRDVRAERADLARRQDNLPRDLHTARAALAEAAGLELADLPFVAELVEVRTEHEPWRAAFNLALGGFATTVLIDAARLSAFRKAIDTVPTARRIRYRAVPTGLRSDARPGTRTLPGRLDYRESPFTGWLKSWLAERFDYVCVDTPGELSQHEKALTRAGQTAQGASGAHGGRGTNVLGFTNTRGLAELDARISEVQARHDAALRARDQAEATYDMLDEHRAACLDVRGAVWAEVDLAAADAEVTRWEGVIVEVTSGNPEVDGLRREAGELDAQADGLLGERGQAERDVAELTVTWGRTVDEVDAAQRALDEARASGCEVTDAQRDYLDGLLVGAGVDDAPGSTPLPPQRALDAFDQTMRQVDDRLRGDRQAAQAAVETGCQALRTAFETFCERWPDPNLGTDPDESYGDFDQILTELTAHGLHELEEDWRRSLLRLSGNDLTDLDNALSRARRQISERIDPVNEILAGLPFADDDHRLRIDARPVQSAELTRFRRELRVVREMLDGEATDEQRAARYTRMARLIDRVRPGSPDVAELIDVRRHVRISAEKVDQDGAHVALYDHIGEKSGGESQELVAFIVGAALRYQLGDPGAERPRYAPVFLDEALIKADARFTGRAVGAWRGLGFQLIIAAPDDKVTALEPHVDAQYRMLKDTTGRSRTRPVVTLPAP